MLVLVSSTIEAEDEITDLELNRNTANENVLQFTAMGKKFNLPLAPVDDIFAPGFHVYYARSLPNGETKLEVLEESSKALKGTFFQVLPTQGAVYLEKSGDSYQLQGIIDDDKRLVNYQPNSYKLIKLSWVNAKKNPFERANDVASFSGHQILKRKLQVTDKSLKKNKVRIDTLVILDDSHIKRLEAAKISIKKYLGIYWNSVKRRYADIERPKINFRLTGVITADVIH
uniref:Uncharacterized protein n=1 Tax=Strigamia maritima TaxID=126957 RepID=T1IYR4_STRMM